MDVLYTNKYSSFVGSENGYFCFRNKLRARKFTELIQPRADDVILEIGCNNASLLNTLSNFSKRVYGIDVNEKAVEELNVECVNVKFMSATDLEFRDNFFDKVCSFEVIEHIADIKRVFSEAYRVLKVEGRFYVSFPVEIFRGQQALLDAMVIYRNPFYARKLHVHRLTPRRIKKTINGLDFKIIFNKIMLIPFPSYVMIFKKT